MRKSLTYQIMSIPNKFRLELTLTFDPNFSMFKSSTSAAGDSYDNYTFNPLIKAYILRPLEADENGLRKLAPIDPNDSLIMTKYSYPRFVDELMSIYEGMKIPELYTYQGSKLELNKDVAEGIRKVFTMKSRTSTTVVELSAVVMDSDTSPDGEEKKIEGVKIKFNNEQSTAMLSLDDLLALKAAMATPIDNIMMFLYEQGKNVVTKAASTGKFIPPVVDVTPKADAELPF